MSPEYLGKHINTTSDYIRVLLLDSQKKNYFIFFKNKASNIMSIKQYPLYATLEHTKIFKHFIGMTHLSKLVETNLLETNVFKEIK